MLNIATGAAERNPLSPDQPEVNDVEDLPLGFDPERSPIIAQHWFGINPAAVGVETVAQAV